MSRVDNLIDEFCPRGVPHHPLGDVAEYSRTRIDSENLGETNFVGVDNLVSDKGGRVNASHSPNTARLAGYYPGDILIGNIRPYLKKIWLADRTGGCSGDVLPIRITPACKESITPEFLYFILSSDRFFSFNMKHAKGGKMPRGSKPDILRYLLPIPPVPVQQEIVRILDSFVKLEAELEAELEARRAQYAYYLDFSYRDLASAYTKKSMGTVGSIVRGRRFTKKDFSDTGVPAIHYGEIYTRFGPSTDHVVTYVNSALASSLRYAQPNDVVIVGVGEDIEEVGQGVAWLGDEPVAIHDDSFSYSSELNPEFVSYFLRSQPYRDQKRHMVSLGKMKRLSSKAIGTIQIPVPPRDIQDKIAAEFKSFDRLVNDLSSGLPAEIQARRQQYEYYRDKLLTFEELPA